MSPTGRTISYQTLLVDQDKAGPQHVLSEDSGLTVRSLSPTWSVSGSPAACLAIANDPTRRLEPPPMPRQTSFVALEEY
jgi:hypothetical protein